MKTIGKILLILLFTVHVAAAQKPIMNDWLVPKTRDILGLPPIDIGPDVAFAIIDELDTKQAILDHSDYFTPKGKELALWACDEFGGKEDKRKRKISPATIQDIAATIVITCDDDSRYEAKLLKIGRWKLDDIRITRLGGRKVDFLMSDMKDHEFTTLLKNFPMEMAEVIGKGFMKGFMFGKRLFR